MKNWRNILGRMIVCVWLGLLPVHASAQARGDSAAQETQTEPPFAGTIFISPNILTASDPTTYQGVTATGQGMRTMFDRRVNDWITVNAYLFMADFADGLGVEIQVNPEFGSGEAAQGEAERYGEVIGRLPKALRTDVQTVWIHQGVQPFGGGNHNLLIHTGQAVLYEADGILEETLVHEAAHTSLDGTHAAAPGWLAAQTADDAFISTYARDFPEREDIAESFLPYLALRYRAERISAELAQTIEQTIPNRIAYFDQQALEMAPVAATHLLFLPLVNYTLGTGDGIDQTLVRGYRCGVIATVACEKMTANSSPSSHWLPITASWIQQSE